MSGAAQPPPVPQVAVAMESVPAGPTTPLASQAMALERAQPLNTVQVVSSTWARDSHDLFDFEAHHLHTKTMNVQRSSTCVRQGTDVQMLGQHDAVPANADQLLRLVQKDGMFWVDKAAPNNSSKKLWLVVRDLATCGQRLSE